MKILFTVCAFIFLFACSNSGGNKNTVIQTHNFLHDIAPFTSDSLINVVIEIPAGTSQKWEVNKETGHIEWEHITPDSFRVINYLPFPANYGFVPQTLLPKASGGDGDPVDVFVLGPSIPRGSIVKTKILGIINTLDDGQTDTKLLAVEINKPSLNISSYDDLVNGYPGIVDIIKTWLTNYKGPGRVKILSSEDERDAIHFLNTAQIDYFNKQ